MRRRMRVRGLRRMLPLADLRLRLLTHDRADEHNRRQTAVLCRLVEAVHNESSLPSGLEGTRGFRLQRSAGLHPRLARQTLRTIVF